MAMAAVLFVVSSVLVVVGLLADLYESNQW